MRLEQLDQLEFQFEICEMGHVVNPFWEGAGFCREGGDFSEKPNLLVWEELARNGLSGDGDGGSSGRFVLSSFGADVACWCGLGLSLLLFVVVCVCGKRSSDHEGAKTRGKAEELDGEEWSEEEVFLMGGDGGQPPPVGGGVGLLSGGDSPVNKHLRASTSSNQRQGSFVLSSERGSPPPRPTVPPLRLPLDQLDRDRLSSTAAVSPPNPGTIPEQMRPPGSPPLQLEDVPSLPPELSPMDRVSMTPRASSKTTMTPLSPRSPNHFGGGGGLSTGGAPGTGGIMRESGLLGRNQVFDFLQEQLQSSPIHSDIIEALEDLPLSNAKSEPETLEPAEKNLLVKRTSPLRGASASSPSTSGVVGGGARKALGQGASSTGAASSRGKNHRADKIGHHGSGPPTEKAEKALAAKQCIEFFCMSPASSEEEE